VGTRAYKLDVPTLSLIHPVFHVSQLKEFVPDHTSVFHELPKLVELDQMEVEPKAILDRCLVQKGGSAIPQGLIKWKNIDLDGVTSEDLTVFKARFPTFSA
jgi:hypothetical protein